MMKKRVVSLLMTVCMLIGMLPAMSVTASAEDDHASHNADYTIYWGIATAGSDKVLHIAKTLTAVNGGKTCDVVAAVSASTNQTTPDWSSYSGTITRVVVDNVVRPKLTEGWFKNCSQVTSMDLAYLDTCCVTYTTSMFEGCSRLTSLDVSNFNTSNVEHMTSMFEGCSSLTSLDVSSFNTSKVTNVTDMFNGCSSLNTINLSAWNQNGSNTKKVTGLFKTFQGCSSLQTINLAGFDTSSLTQMDYAFDGCSSLESIDLAGFGASSVESMECTFRNTSALKILDLSGFDVSSVNVTNSFLKNSGVEVLNLGNFNLSFSFYTDSAFSNVKLKELTVHGVTYEATDATISPELSTYSDGWYSYVKVSAEAPVTITSLTTTPNRATHITGKKAIIGKKKNIITVPAGDTITMAGGASYTPSGAVEVDVSTGSISSIPDGTTVKVTNPNSASASDYPGGYWIAGNYTYETNGGTFAADPFAVLYPNQDFTLPTNITKTGYSFDGWYANSELTGSPVATIVAGSTGSKQFWAKWTPITYKITYTLNGGTVTPANPTDYTIETAAITLKNPTRTGYTFTGWSGTGLSGSANTSVTIPASSTGDRSYTANWTVNQYTITFNSNGGSTIAPIKQNYGTVVNAPTPTKTGYTFTGWSPALPSTMPAGDLTVTAQWKPSVTSGVVITTDSLPDATFNIGYTAAITASQADGVRLKLVNESGNALASQTVNGLTLSENGAISGTPTAAGTVTLRVCPFNYDGTAVGDVATLAITVNKATGTASVTLANCTYGAPLNPTPTSETNGTANVTYQYSADGINYTATPPANVGSYTVKATFAETANYNAVTATDDFQIIKDTGATVTMSDKTVDYGEPTAMTATAQTSTGIVLTGNVTIKYYTDPACPGEGTATPPTAAGTYYAKAVLSGTTNYDGKETIAKLTINRVDAGSVSVPVVTAPVYGETAQTAVSNGTYYTATIAWSPALVGGKFAPATAYTATVTLTPDSNHKFTSAPGVTGWGSTRNDNGTVALTKTFAPTAPNCTFSFDGTNANKLMGSTADMEYSLDGGTSWKPCSSANMAMPADDISSIDEAKDIQVRVKASSPVPAGAVQTIAITKAGTPNLTATQPSVINGKGSIPTTDFHEYSTNQASWKPCAGKMTDLAPATYYVRVKARGTVLASTAQEITISEYVPRKEVTPNATFIATGPDTGNLNNLIAGGTYTVTGANPATFTASGTTQALTNVSAGTLSVVKKGNDTTTIDSVAQTIDVTKPEAPNATGTNCTAAGANNGTITSVSNAMEYRKSGDSGWTEITGATVTGLAKGSYEVRYKANGTALASQAKSVTITAPAVTPTASFDAATRTLTNVESGMQYSKNGSDWVGITGTTVDLSSVVTGPCTITVKNPGIVSEHTTDATQTITVTKAAKPDGVDKTDCTTSANNDGTITSVSTAMEYRKSGTSGWTEITGATVTDLTNDDYEVRVKASGSTLASDAVTVTIYPRATIDTTSFQNATFSTAYEQTVSVNCSGVTTVVLKVVDASGTPISSDLGKGLTLTADQKISGTPTEAGSVTFKIRPFLGDTAIGEAKEFTITIDKANGTASVAMANWTYGAAANAPTPTSTTNGTANVTYQYKLADAADDAYAATVPADAGSYTVQATFAETANYNAVTATVNFQILKDTGATVAMSDKEVDYGTSAEMTAMTATAKTSTNKGLDANLITIKYYTNDACTVGETSTPPTEAGTYYAKAVLSGTGNYNGASATATLTINRVEVCSVSVPTVTAPVYGEDAQAAVTVPDGSDYTAAITWSPALVGGKFAPGTTYTATVTLTPDGNHKFTAAPSVDGWTSQFSAGKVELTMTFAPTAPNCTFSFDGNDANKLMDSTAAMEYSLDGGTNWNPCTSADLELTAADVSSIDEAKDIQVRVKASSPVPAGAVQIIDITKAAAPAGVGKTNCSTYANNNGTITGVSTAMEYRKSGASGWTVITGDTVSSLTNGDYEVRVKASGTALASDAVSVTISAYSGSSTPTHRVESTVSKDAGGSVSFSKSSAKKGDEVTITLTPDRYYKVAGVIVKDKNGKEIAVTDNGDGTFTFKMPDSKVSVEPVFSWDNPFADVSENAYYAPAVEWALKNEVTGGTTTATFSPNTGCTRAQIVTFLWRAAGCPEPAGAKSFTDVSADAYYAKAVAWAAEQGITGGTGDGKFSPDAVCTRSQSMTFIYRSEQAQGGGMQGEWMFPNPFADVNLEDYYGEAVMWAAANGVTSGTSDTTFSPTATCTRGQIVTFLYRFFVK
ncbi:MAG: S-layer homology domain-containing protein [Hominicoprocola sp.]